MGATPRQLEMLSRRGLGTALKTLSTGGDIAEYRQVPALWDAFGRVDIWINNAGLSAPTYHAWKLPETTLRAVCKVNLLRMMHSSKVSLTGWEGSEALYNTQGLGSNGLVLSGSVLYGATKRLGGSLKKRVKRLCWSVI